MKMKKLLISSLFLTSLFTLSSCSFITNIFGPDDDDDITSAQTTTSTSTSTNTSTQTSTNTSTSTQTSTITSIVQTYTLTFDPNGGEGTSVSISGKEIGDLIYLPDCSFVNAGFSFYGWYDGQNTYQANDEYEVIGNVTFKALWDNEDTYHITYVTGNGKNSSSNPAIYETLDNVELIDAQVPEGFDYEFDGWYTSLDFDDKVTNLYGRSGDLTLYAAYTRPLYWYDLEGTKYPDKTVIDVEYSDGVLSRIINYGLFYNTPILEVNLSNVSFSVMTQLNQLLNSIEQNVHKNYYNTNFRTNTHGSNITLTIEYDFGTNGQENTSLTDYSSYQGDFISFAKKEGNHGLYNYKLSNTVLENLETSDQLYYALENGYNFTILPGSLAEEVYNASIEALDDIIDENMSEKEKILAISAYIMKNVNYDHLLAGTAGSVDNANTYQYYGHFASGALLEGNAVCDGYAKAFTILCGLEGIKSKVSRGYLGNVNGGHAWNKVFIDADDNGTKEWYTVDLTNSEIGATLGTKTYEASNYSRILITDYDLINLGYAYRGKDLIDSDVSGLNDEQKYAKGQDLSNITDLSETFFDIYDDTTFTYQSGLHENSYNFVVSNQNELNTIINQNKSQILASNIFILSVEGPDSLSVNTLLVGLSQYNYYTINQKIYKSDETEINVRIFVFIKN